MKGDIKHKIILCLRNNDLTQITNTNLFITNLFHFLLTAISL